jgi:hypothetical protein
MSSGNISPVFAKMFSDECKVAYAGLQKLANTTQEKTNVIGSSAQFQVASKGIAQAHAGVQDVTPMGIDFTPSVATLTPYVAPEYTTIFQQQQISFDERRVLVETIASAIGRRMDQEKIDAMTASGTTNNVAVGLGGNNAFNMAKLRRLGKLLDEQAVPESGRHIAWSTAAKEQLLATTEATSSDFNTVMALVNGTLDSFYGFKFHMIETRDEGGLPLSGNNRTVYAWHEDSIGTAVGVNFRTEINYIAEKVGWLVNGLFSCGAVAIDPKGIASATIDESVVV